MTRLNDDVRRALAWGARNSPEFRGRRRLLGLADRLLREDPDKERLREVIDGVTFALDTRDIIDFNLLYSGAHDSAVVRLIVSRLRAQGGEGVLWDVGGNVGAVALQVAAASGSIVRAFEPSPPVRARFEANLALNAKLRGQVEVLPWALADSSGQMDFFVSNEVHNSGVGGLSPAGNRESAASRVSVYRGDELIAKGTLPAPTFIKIDVEGHELEVLKGLEGFFRSGRACEVVFEHELYRVRERGQALDAVSNYLASLGFSLFAFDKGAAEDVPPLRPLTVSDLERRGDLYARLDASRS